MKIVLRKWDKSSKTPTIRVSQDICEAVESLAIRSGLSISKVAATIIREALLYVIIGQPEEDDA